MQDSSTKFDWGLLKSKLNNINQIGKEEQTFEYTIETLNERAERFRREATSAHNETEEMIVFQENEERYAVPLRMLSEIRPITKLTSLPLVSKNILGVINFRGKIVTVYGLSDNTEKKPIEKFNDTYAGDIQYGNRLGSALIGHGVAGNLALFADQVIGTISVSSSEIREAPISLISYDYIVGVGADGLIFLDLEKLVSNTNFYMA